MAEFKVGDRVQVDCDQYQGTAARSGTGTISARALAGRRGRWEVRLDDSQALSYKTRELTLLDRPPYEPRDGDEVTMSLTGTIRQRDDFWALDRSDGRGDWSFDIEEFADWDVVVHERAPEKPKLPTTPGSVVKDGKDYYVLTDRGYTHCTYANGLGFIPPEAENFSRNHEVIYDAGAAS